MIPAGGTDWLTKAGDKVEKSVVRSPLLGTVMMWMQKWPKRILTDLMVKHYVLNELREALCILEEATGSPPPKPRHDSKSRSGDEAYANDIYSRLEELDRTGKMPEIVVPCCQLSKCPVDTVRDDDPSLLTRMDRLENAVTKMLERPPTTVSPVAAAIPETEARSGFGPALARARSLSKGRDHSLQVQGAVEGRQEQPLMQRPWSEVAGAVGGGLKRGRSGQVTEDGFLFPGRPARKAVPKGSSTVDLSQLNAVLVAPIERYVGNTDVRVTAELVEKALKQCAAGMPDKPQLEVLKVEQINSHLQHARTRAWKVTVPYSNRDILDNAALYPPGWTHRAFFAPRGEMNKRPRHGQQQSNMVATLLQEQERDGVVAQQAAEDRIRDEVETRVQAELTRREATLSQLQA